MVHPIVPALCAFLMPLAAWADESSVEEILPALGKVGVSARQAAAVEVEVVLQGGHSSETGVVEPFNIDFDRDGAMYGVEFIKGNRIFKRTPDGTVTFIAGRKIPTTEKTSDVAEGDGGPATLARFHGMHDLCLTHSDADRAREGKPEDVILVADTFNHRIRRMDLTTGLVTTVAGTGTPGEGDPIKPAAATMLNSPIALCRSRHVGAIWVAEIGNNRVRLFNHFYGNMSLTIGNGERGALVEGAAEGKTPLNGPRGVAADSRHVWIALREGNSLVRHFEGTMQTVVNRSGKQGYGGDEGGPATEAQLNGPKAICLDGDGNPIICDTENHVIRRYLPEQNRMERVAGVPGQPGDALGATAFTTHLQRPHGVRWHEGWLYIADSDNDRILRVRCPSER